MDIIHTDRSTLARTSDNSLTGKRYNAARCSNISHSKLYRNANRESSILPGVLIGLVLFLRTFVHFCKIATVFNSIYLPSRVVKPVLLLIVLLFTHHMFPTRDREPRMARAMIELISGIPLASIDPILTLSALPRSLRDDSAFFFDILRRSTCENISSTPGLPSVAPSHQSLGLLPSRHRQSPGFHPHRVPASSLPGLFLPCSTAPLHSLYCSIVADNISTFSYV